MVESSIIDIIKVALGYTLKAIIQSKAVESDKEELINRYWLWIKSYFVKELPEIDKKTDIAEIEAIVQNKLIELVKDQVFFNDLVKQINTLQKAGIKEKNIFKGDLSGVKEIIIGDKTYSPTDNYDRKNIVKGNINKADKLILGDGH